MQTILIAERDSAQRTLIHATLASDAYQIVEASNGDETWQRVVEYRPTVVLLDEALPGRGAQEIARAIKADPDLRSTRVILLQVRPTNDESQADFDEHVSRPFSPLDLLRMVEQALAEAGTMN